MTRQEQVEQEFLKDIRAQPQDDALRLIYADWLDEQGHPERAAFIRVQIRLAVLDFELSSSEDCGHPDCPGCQERRILLGREGELWEAVTADNRFLVPAPYPPALLTALLPQNTLASAKESSLSRVILRRGFASEVLCPVAWWCGRECACTLPEQRRSPDPDCPLCQGLGQTEAHGPALASLQPVEQVRFTDRRPQRIARQPPYEWYWFRAGQIAVPDRDSSADLPACLAQHMDFQLFYAFPSEAKAWQTASQGALAWARAAAAQLRSRLA